MRVGRVIATMLTISAVALSSSLSQAQVFGLPQAGAPTSQCPTNTSSVLTAAQANAAKNDAKKLALDAEKKFNEKKFAEAYDGYSQADERYHLPTLTLMRARAKEKLAELIESRALYECVLAAVLPKTAPFQHRKAQTDAKKELTALEPRIPSVEITLLNAQGGDTVMIDSTEVPASALSAPILQNPGTYTITATTKLGQSVSKSIPLKEGMHEKVELDMPPPPPPPKPEPVATSEPPKPPPSVETKKPIVTKPVEPVVKKGSLAPAAIAFGIGGAFLGMGVVTTVLWQAKNDEILPNCHNFQCPKSYEGDINTATALNWAAIGGYIAGGAAAGIGVVLLVNRNRAPGEPSKPGTAFMVGPGSIGLRGSF